MGESKNRRKWLIKVVRNRDIAALVGYSKSHGRDVTSKVVEVVLHKMTCAFPETADLAPASREWLEQRGMFAPANEDELRRREASANIYLMGERMRASTGKHPRIGIKAMSLEDAVRRTMAVFKKHPIDMSDFAKVLEAGGPPIAAADGYRIAYSLDKGKDRSVHHFTVSRQDQKKIEKQEVGKITDRVLPILGIVRSDSSKWTSFQGMNPSVIHIMAPEVDVHQT